MPVDRREMSVVTMRLRNRTMHAADLLQAEKGEVDLFVETVVEPDGRVSTVRLLGGDEERARPIVEALRYE